MLSLLNPDARSRAEELREEFDQAQPFAHIVMDNFLEPSFCEALMEEFPAFEERAARNEIGAVGRKAAVSQIATIGPAYRRFDQLMRSREFLDWTGHATGTGRLLYDPDYTGGGTHENLSGQDLDFHVDFNYHPSRMLHRRLNLIIFLNPVWEAAWGGCLELRDDPWVEDAVSAVTIVPLFNRAVIFETTEVSWHGFSRICLPSAFERMSRRSIAVYFYSKERPVEQTAPSHSTIYVPRALPSRFRAGRTLSAEDQSELETLIARRDTQIRFLYEREKEIARVMAAMTRSRSFRLGRALTWPLRKLTGRV